MEELPEISRIMFIRYFHVWQLVRRWEFSTTCYKEKLN